MDKQSFVLEIVKHFICDKITKGVGAQSTLCDEKFIKRPRGRHRRQNGEQNGL